MRALALTVLLALCAVTVCAAEPGEEAGEADYLELGALMLRDGNLDRALTALQKVDTEAEEFDSARYRALLGMTHARMGNHSQAVAQLRKAIDAGSGDPLVYVHLAQSSFQIKDYKGVLEALDDAPARLYDLSSVWHMRAQSHWLLKNRAGALAILDQASARFSEDHSFLRRKVFYLIEMGLYRRAAALGRLYLERSQGSIRDYVAIGSALRQSGQVDQALVFLEQARLMGPLNPDASKALASAYIDQGRLNVAADILYQAAQVERDLLVEAAELYRRAGQYYRALSVNTQVADSKAKFKQRLAILLELQQHEKAAAMRQDLYRSGLLQNDNIRYGLAYAYFKTGDFDATRELLAALEDSDLFRKGVELRRAMEDCAGAAWKCM